MVFLSDETDPDSSGISADSNNTCFEEKQILILARQLLKGRMFIGIFQEKRYVESLYSYRDVVSIPQNETELINSLRDVEQHIAKYYSTKNYWVGITDSTTVGLPATYCIWVQLPDQTALGTYWFKVKGIRVRSNEILLVIKIERKLEELNQEVEPRKLVSSESNIFDDWLDTSKVTFQHFKKDISRNALYFFNNITTPHNIKEVAIFLGVMLLAFVTGSFELLKVLLDFLLKFMYAFSHFLNAATPIFQITFNFLENLFKVFCTLIAYLFGGRQSCVNYKPQFRALPLAQRQQRAKITELN